MFEKMRKRMSGEGGFTLIELLVVIIIIAILAAIAIPTFLGQRSKAQDAAAKSLVRNAMTAVESQYVDTSTYATVTVAGPSVPATPSGTAAAIEPSITFVAAGAGTIAVGSLGGAVSTTVTHSVDYDGTATTGYGIGTVSASNNKFGVFVSKATGTTFLKIISGGGVQASTSAW